MSYAELDCISNFTFLRGAAHPQELVAQAARLGYAAIAITDECSLAGVVKAHVAAREAGIKLIIGSEFKLEGSSRLVVLAPNRAAYTELSGFITLARRRSQKGSYCVHSRDFEFCLPNCLLIWLPENFSDPECAPLGRLLESWFGGRLWLGVTRLYRAGDMQHYMECHRLAVELDISMVACGNVHMHIAERGPLQDILTAIRLNRALSELGIERQTNHEHYLRPLNRLQRLYPEALLQETLHIARQCVFSLEELRYQYPKELVPPHLNPADYLQQLVAQGAHKRWPAGVPESVGLQITAELALIRELAYEYYFLTVFDIVSFARDQSILCQGRGSAANSVVCYCLFITEVNPQQISLLFERFISRERSEPPDIDVDFEHHRREEVIQYIYKKYSRERAALVATVITYRMRSAVRDVGKALGLDISLIEQLSRSLAWWDRRDELLQHFSQAHRQNPQLADHFIRLVTQILGFPRHLSQHVGGFIICDAPVSELVPVENASMPERTVIQWDKTDIQTLGLLKVDILGLGMLSAIRRCLQLVNQYTSTSLTLDSIPREDPDTYAMLCRGDSVGVFQVESRAQMSMLPRLKPRKFYDLVIEVAIVRPGPIQGDMVHPYLQRRDGLEPICYESEVVRDVLERTLGVPIFQEQVIRLAMVAAGFSGGQADQLRRAMTSWGRNDNLLKFREQLMEGMLAHGHNADFAQRLFNQIKGFGSYGFPESHAASFALLVYFSAWLKCHHPAAFYCALLNSQPMGFYSASQLMQDARRRSIVVRAVDIRYSTWDASLEDIHQAPAQQPALRLGLRMVRGFNSRAAQRLVAARRQQAFVNLQDLCERAGLDRSERTALIRANALYGLAGHRHQAHWDNQAIAEKLPLYSSHEYAHKQLPDPDDGIALPAPDEKAELLADYNSLGLTLNRHPMAILRTGTALGRCLRAAQLESLGNRRFVRVAGIVTGRQRPGTASGVIFLTLEDETGNLNIIVWKSLQQRCRRALLGGKLLLVKGVLERKGSVIHIIAGDIQDHSDALAGILLPSRDFR